MIYKSAFQRLKGVKKENTPPRTVFRFLTPPFGLILFFPVFFKFFRVAIYIYYSNIII